MKTIVALAALGVASSVALTATPAAAQMALSISVNFAPPALPVYDQPPIPGPDYMWVPGYWAWDDDVQDYYWIPGTWVMAPRPGLLWTPAWWGWQDGIYMFHPGYWAPHVGFYGGVAYGFGYSGSGYEGAYWNGGHVFYNRSVTNITNVNVTNVYNKVVVAPRSSGASFNGGPGGVQARPSPAEQMAMREQHMPATPQQVQNRQAARANRQLFASSNHGKPPVAATARPAQFGGPNALPAREAPAYHPPASQARPNTQRFPANPADARNASTSQPLAAPDQRRPTAPDAPRSSPAVIREDHMMPHPQPVPEGEGADKAVTGVPAIPETDGRQEPRPLPGSRPAAPAHAAPSDPRPHAGGGGRPHGQAPARPRPTPHKDEHHEG